MEIKRKKLVIGNWKMFKDAVQASADFENLSDSVTEKNLSIEVGIAAPSIFLADLARKTRNTVSLFAQNAHWAEEGAFTGEVSPTMLKSIHVLGSLVAHSERRQMFAETNQTAGGRISALLNLGMRAIYCVGETLVEREKGLLKEILISQLEQAFIATKIRNSQSFIGSDPNKPLLSIAYEPVWAIGTGKAASAVEAQEAHTIIRNFLQSYFGEELGNRFQILYGGSVKASNVNEYINCPNIDGALVGGASLVPKDFLELCMKCAN
ncbi:triose-phosphate isomerase [Pigmentibacter sp. JX0631]|uniref:triose-phosphate isomerase n=1 Tax=Pigmentibacter sp. JX0631 TaxID=2976982 RepID=UPI0024695676|nr:triose-phosphate isomerase [Pigmentibacter sp. JX0631]WGL60250.1 triose-phosphate isomerase [Pigmentibacter sp. JX0631]